jgi:two-component system, LytTR family, sensor histidine kinase AlgZ
MVSPAERRAPAWAWVHDPDIARDAALVPPAAAFLYLLTPPFLALLFDPRALSGDFDGFWAHLAATWIHAVAIGGLIHAQYVWLVPRLLRGAATRAARLAVHGGAIGLGLAGGLLLSFPVTALLCDGSPRNLGFEFYSGGLIASALVGGVVAFQAMRARARQVELHAQRATAAAVRAELDSLRARTDPHFLFNALNTVAGLISKDPRQAEATVERLADVFRYTLDASRRPRVSVQRELDIVSDYLAVEAIRFGDRMAWDIDCAPELAGASVPPLILQPLVENAVRHGIGEKREGGRIAIRVHRAGGMLAIEVSDDGPGPAGSTQRGSGTSLRDLRERLALEYGASASHDLIARPGGGAIARITVPLETRP